MMKQIKCACELDIDRRRPHVHICDASVDGKIDMCSRNAHIIILQHRRAP